uniref:Fibronectin type-III domain-containing protein n=1 Tax=Acrobeloides nanus TaxID=290746 RepID=A0A914BZP8_9BILA
MILMIYKFSLKLLINTHPQCTKSTSVECEGETSLQVSWIPGYDGGSAQQFRAFHRKQGKLDWQSTEYFNESQILLQNLEPFSSNEIQIEASNGFGAINCTSVSYHVCSKLVPPQNLKFTDEKLLQWDKVPEATSYKVSYRKEKGSRFRDIMEVPKTEALLDLETLNHTPEVELRVRSIRRPFSESEPSDSIVYQFSESSSLLTYLLFGGLLFILLLLIFCIFVRRQSKTSTKIRKLRPSFKNFAGNKNSMYLYARSDSPVLPMNDQNESPWNLRDDKLCANVDELNDSFLDSDFDNGAIAEMFKEKYIYSDSNRKFDVLDEIRIARLKREFGQSQL